MPSNLKADAERDILSGFKNALTGSGSIPTTEEEKNDLFTKYTEDLLHNNPYKPPKGCPINNLPNELLAYIFQVGAIPDEDEDDDELGYLTGSDVESDDEDDLDLSAPTKRHELPEGVQVKDLPEADANDASGEWVDEDEDDDSSCCSGSGSSASSTTEYDDSEEFFQILVSHVCKRWREVALSSPGLWATVSFSEGRPFARSIAFLERLQGHPLNIDIDCQRVRLVEPSHDGSGSDSDSGSVQEEKPFYSQEDIVTMMDLIVPHVSRWRSLQLLTNDYAHMHTALTALSKCSSAPLLETLQLYHYDDADDAAEFEPKELNQSFRILGGDAPKLSVMALWGVHIDWDSPGLFAHLTDIELAYHAKDVRPAWNHFITVLKSSPTLETVTLCQAGPGEEPSSWSDDIVELPSVKNLMMRYQEPAYIEALMKRLAFVNVNTLTLDYDTDNYSGFVKQLAEPIPGGRKSLLSQLERLKVAGMPTEHKAIDTLYAELQNCTNLNLNLRGLDAVWFDKLRTVPEGGNQLPVPRLNTLVTMGVDGDQLKDMVAIREKAGLSLKKVYIAEQDELDEEAEKWLKEHVEVEFFEPSDSEEDDDNPFDAYDDLEDGMIIELD